MQGKLYIVGTPIGNLEDISLRALRVLKGVDLILAEDTRRTRGLLTHYNIHTSLTSYHKHNERGMADRALRWLREGRHLALVTDAGLPGISDPGEHLIRQVRQKGMVVEVVPGPTAFALALIASGLPADRFTFWGFVPRVGKDREELFVTALSRLETGIFYEAPTRIGRTLADLAALVPERPAAVARELTKIHEEIKQGSLAELAQIFGGQETKGEICLVVAGRSPEEKELSLAAKTPPPTPEELVAHLQAEGFERKQALREAAKRLGLSRREVYQHLVRQKQKKDTNT
ncbi:MAG: 16S rRNA (cytidine(1402)-2'-O)-methyltransferase [bacterium]